MGEISVYANSERACDRCRRRTKNPRPVWGAGVGRGAQNGKITYLGSLTFGNHEEIRNEQREASDRDQPLILRLYTTKSPSGTEISLIGFRNDSD